MGASMGLTAQLPAAQACPSSPPQAWAWPCPIWPASLCRPLRAPCPGPAPGWTPLPPLPGLPMFATVVWLVWVLGQTKAASTARPPVDLAGGPGSAFLVASRLGRERLRGWAAGTMAHGPAAVGLVHLVSRAWQRWRRFQPTPRPPPHKAGSPGPPAPQRPWWPAAAGVCGLHRRVVRDLPVQQRNHPRQQRGCWPTCTPRTSPCCVPTGRRRDPAITAALAQLGRNGDAGVCVLPPRQAPVVLDRSAERGRSAQHHRASCGSSEQVLKDAQATAASPSTHPPDRRQPPCRQTTSNPTCPSCKAPRRLPPSASRQARARQPPCGAVPAGAGYRIVPISPSATEVLGERSWPSLTEAAKHHRIDLVDVFRDSAAVPPLPTKRLPSAPGPCGCRSVCAMAKPWPEAQAAGLKVVQDRCTLVEHQRLRSAGLLAAGTPQ